MLRVVDMVELKTSDDKDDMRKAAELLIKCSEVCCVLFFVLYLLSDKFIITEFR